MKTLSQSTLFNPSVIVLGILVLAFVTLTIAGKKVPILTNFRANLVILVILGMAMCMQGGLARVAATNAWTHPLSYIGYILGGAILIVAVAGFFNIKLPFLQTSQQAFIWVALLIVLKVINSLSHHLLSRS